MYDLYLVLWDGYWLRLASVCMYICMLIGIFVSIHVCMFICMLVCIYAYLYVSPFVYLYVSFMSVYLYLGIMYVYMYCDLSVCISLCWSAYMCTCMLVSMYMCFTLKWCNGLMGYVSPSPPSWWWAALPPPISQANRVGWRWFGRSGWWWQAREGGTEEIRQIANISKYYGSQELDWRKKDWERK